LAFENQRKFYNLKWALKTFSKDDGVGFCWDCGHENCFTPGQEFMPIFGNRIICTHIHDNNGVYNDDSHLLPFDGNIDFKKVIYQLEKANFSGSLMLEVTAANEKYDKISFEEYLRRAFISAKKLTKI
jgi:sugar phosphate isomerase/epimerase